jgi:Bacterial SH3 domain
MRSVACASALAAALIFSNAQAEALYVIDQLIVGVSSTADESGERIATIHSGDRVQVLERRDAYAHVRLSSGTDGWVKASYLSPELPLQQKLTSQVQELDRLKQELTRLQGEASAAVPVAVPVVREVPNDPPAALTDAQASGAHPLWQWVLGSAVVALLGGFALGWRMLDRRIRRKYGGLRIY